MTYMIITKTQKEKYNRYIIEQYKDELASFDDLLGDGYDELSGLFYTVNKRYMYWFDNDPNVAVREKDILLRRRLFEIIKRIGPVMLKCTQVYENRGMLIDGVRSLEDIRYHLPDKPVIFVSNHGFHDDALATVLAANRHAYLLMGSLPLVFNTFDGYATSLIGEIIINRKSKKSRAATIPKAKRVLELGTDMIFFPEGGWNKTSELLSLELWKGVYALSCEAKCQVVPIVHYVRNMERLSKKEIIHTVVDAPISLWKMSEKEAMQSLRDNFATWTWRMMEKYGRSTRQIEMRGYDSSDIRWHHHLQERMKGVARYDSSIEKKADYRSPDIIRPEVAFEKIANINNISLCNVQSVLHAKQLMKQRMENDFQRLY